MIEILAGTAAGVALGLLSGLLPGIHVNTLAAIMLATLALLLPLFGPIFLAAALFSALITHCFLDAIPSTFLGIPDADTALAVLPAHALCMEGKGEEAVRISALGSVTGLLLAVPLCGLLLLLMPHLQSGLDWASGIILVAVIGFLLVQSEAPGWGLLVFCASGLLGVFSFRYSFLAPPLLGESAVLMPLLSGLFGISMLLYSGKGAIPAQHFSGLGISRGGILKGTLLGGAAGLVVGWLPGLSNATANGVLASAVSYTRDRRGYLLATSAANTMNAVVGLAAFFAVERTRNGVVAALTMLEMPSLPLLLVSGTLAALAAYLLTIYLAGMADFMEGVDRARLNWAVMACVACISLLGAGIFGIFLLVMATAIGCIPRLVNVPQVFCMGAIMVPVMLYSFGFGGV
ncbi:MAG: tripartite tricarboxylate transporter permease [Methanolinea sp.]|nr:tripartite tricarboxylate transporter permease [Methanolinea sp.]